MLKKVNRLKKRYQFNYVYKAGKKFNEKAVTLYVSSSKTKNIKVGFAVTKKIGHAFKRNLIKRRLREIVYKFIPSLKQDNNIIVVAKDTIEDYSFEMLEKQVYDLLSKADLFNEKNL